MKKHLVLGALAVLALAACSKTETLEVNKGNEISLSAVTGKNLTKAADGYCNSSLPDNFVVWAATDSKKYFEAEVFNQIGSTNTYTSSAAYYWPTTSVDFFATKNQNGTTTTFNYDSTPTSLVFEGYTVDNTVANQTDFLYAVTKGATKAGVTTLNFRHALSQIEFQAKNENAKIHVEISDLTLKNICSKGDFYVSDATTTAFVDHNLGVTPDTDNRIGRCSWSNQSTLASYTIAPESKDLINGGNLDISVTDASGEYNPRTMYLLPQDVTNIWDGTGTPDSSTEAYFLLTAKIYNVSGAVVNKGTDVVLHDGTIAVPIPAGTEWKDGLRYVYTFNFTSTGTGGIDPGTGDPVLTPITLTVSVDDFVDAGNTEVNVE